jgi:hypothetical protein
MTKYDSILLGFSPESSKTISSHTETKAHFISTGTSLVSTVTDRVNNNLTLQYHTFSGAKTKASTPHFAMTYRECL